MPCVCARYFSTKSTANAPRNNPGGARGAGEQEGWARRLEQYPGAGGLGQEAGTIPRSRRAGPGGCYRRAGTKGLGTIPWSRSQPQEPQFKIQERDAGKVGIPLNLNSFLFSVRGRMRRSEESRPNLRCRSCASFKALRRFSLRGFRDGRPRKGWRGRCRRRPRPRRW